ncbi:MAG: ATP-binding protein [Chloroflexota bacterium]|nr:ATP-binding protein [Chloroflexota bacterium]
MISVLAKPIDEIGVDDVKELIASKVREGERIEFKRSLRTKGDGTPDGWLSDARTIGPRAKNKILEEAVAFANAYGGALVLGVAESRAKPPEAARISPIPRCEDLAASLNQVFRNRVEPEIPRIEIFAVPTEADGSGVVILRTNRSRMAPHRVTETLKCPIRRADRCEEMTMREIQDLTLNLSRGIERLERRLKQRSKRFAEEFKRLETPDCAVGFRMTAAPAGEEVRLDTVYGEDKLYEPWHRVSLSIEDRHVNLEFPWWGMAWRPMLRAARCEYSGRPSKSDLEIYREIHGDGLVEIGLVYGRVQRNGGRQWLTLYSEWLMTVFANLIIWADRVRNEATMPTVEYAVGVELNIRGENVSVAGYGRDAHSQPFGIRDFSPGSVKYPGELLGEPRYSLGEAGEIPDLIELFERDFWNSVGHDVGRGKRSFVTEHWPGYY